MPSDQQAGLKTEVRALIEQKGWSIKFAAERAGVGSSTLYNWFNGGDELGELSVIKLSKVLGGEIEQLFYNSGHDPAKTPIQTPAPQTEAEEWKANIREVERYLRSIDDPHLRLKESERLLAAARVAVEQFERAAELRAQPARAQDADAPQRERGKSDSKARPGKGVAERGGA